MDLNKKIAKHLGYSYVPWNNPNRMVQGWQRLDVSESLRPYTHLCQYHRELNFDCDIRRSELILNYLIDCRYSYTINHAPEGVTITIKKPNTEDLVEFGKDIPEVVYKAFLRIIK